MEHLLSEHVADFQLDREELSVKATWATVLDYDLHEDARSQVDTVQRPRLASAMTQAMSDPTVRERHFTTPTALLTTAEGKGHQTSVASANVPS